MDGQPPMMLSFPRPGRALWAVMIVLAVVGIGCATAAMISPPTGSALFEFLWCDVAHPLRRPWGFFTSGLLTSPQQWSHLLFSLLGFYFLGAPLEQRWGAWRFVRLLVIAVLLGNIVTVGASALLPGSGADRLHPPFTFGPAAAIAAIAVAWAREFPNSTVNLFFFVPMRGKTLLWITVAFCALDLIYPAPIPEGILAPFAGVGAGLLLGGTPSPLRALWLRLRLAGLRARSKHVRPEDVLSPPRRPRPGGPPLRVVPGGLDDVLKKRTPPKDKRYLN